MTRLTLQLYDQALKLREQLSQIFPKCFFPVGQEKPLKIGIFHELVHRCDEISPMPDKKLIQTFIALYTSSISYRAALIAPDAVRVDLYGNTCSRVTPKERYKAKVTTKQIRWVLATERFEVEQAKAKLNKQPKKQKTLVHRSIAGNYYATFFTYFPF